MNVLFVNKKKSLSQTLYRVVFLILFYFIAISILNTAHFLQFSLLLIIKCKTFDRNLVQVMVESKLNKKKLKNKEIKLFLLMWATDARNFIRKIHMQKPGEYSVSNIFVGNNIFVKV